MKYAMLVLLSVATIVVVSACGEQSGPKDALVGKWNVTSQKRHSCTFAKDGIVEVFINGSSVKKFDYSVNSFGTNGYPTEVRMGRRSQKCEFIDHDKMILGKETWRRD